MPPMKNLFDHAREERLRTEQPLAARMRPRCLEEYIGQDHILAPGRLLRRAIQADRLSSLIFYGPPGTGKTTLASVIAHTTTSHFEQLNAVLAGVADVRRVTREAQQRHGEYNQRTILFVDEVHRWNKAQQDALLPWVENGTIVFIGATTENPFFTVNRALVSRSRIFQLKPLGENDLRRIIAQTLKDPERGYGTLDIHLHEEAIDHLIKVANGDARAVLNALELAVETTTPTAAGVIDIDLGVAEESIQRRAVLYDKEGDYHFDTISAFIKSLRGSDPDAALYWLAKMVYAGEDPRFLFRRMLIFCGEDIGLADPDAMRVCVAAAEAFDRVGMPEGRYHLGFATLYLATAPKSNSVMGFFDALEAVEKEGEGDVPNHLRDASRDKEGFGHGKGYLYPHAYRDHWVAQQYLPDALQGKVFYQPGELGFEKAIGERVARRREAQLAAVIDGNATAAPPEILTFSPADTAVERWLARTIGDSGAHFEHIREEIFAAIPWQRHWRILDVSADTGLLTWEALRRVPEGVVVSLASRESFADILRNKAADLPELHRPEILVGDVQDLGRLLEDADMQALRFEGVVGRNVLAARDDKEDVLRRIADVLAPGGRLVLLEGVPRHTQRLYRLLDTDAIDREWADRLHDAEEAIYRDPADPLVNWDVDELKTFVETAGLTCLSCQPDTVETKVHLGRNTIDRWFAAALDAERPSYRQHLARALSAAELDRVEHLYRSRLTGQTVAWHSRRVLLLAAKPESSPPTNQLTTDQED